MTHAFLLASLRQVAFAATLSATAFVLAGLQTSAREPSELLATNCLDCHQGKEAEAGLNLAELDSDLSKDATFRAWTLVHDRMASGEMPPPDSGYDLSTADRQEFVGSLSSRLTDHQSNLQAQQGRVRGRRLTNLQLERTLHDLLGIDIPLVREMPEEPRSSHYSTLASRQGFSHFHMEQHLKIVDLALDEAFRRALTESDEWTRKLSAKAISRTRTRTREPEYIDGCAVVWSSNLSFYGRVPATTARESGWYRFEMEVDAIKSPADHGVFCTVRSGQCVSSAPLMAWVSSFEATQERKKVTFETWLPRGHMLEIRPGDKTLKMARFQGGQSANGEGGAQNVPGIQIHRLQMQRMHQGKSDDTIRRFLFGEFAVKLADPRSRRSFGELSKIQRADEQNLLDQIQQFADRAFRRPVAPEVISPFVAIFQDAMSEGKSAPIALRSAYRAILSSPRFLYFQEQPGRLDSYALASRLSYFLWNSMPDDALFRLAKNGQLDQPKTLRSEVDRMLQDQRGENFLRDFAAEWLELQDIDFTQPDRRLYKDFDLIVQDSMVQETLQFLSHLLEHDLPVSNLVKSDFTFVNERLARYYGLPNQTGDRVAKRELRREDRRGGLLGQGAILKVTANGTSTSPVLRGVWVSSKILGEDVPEPPSNVPAIEPDIRGATSIREQLEKHRSSPECAGCHAKIDPPGFALENFDPTGRWREFYPSQKSRSGSKAVRIDPSYETEDGEKFRDFQQFCDIAAADQGSLAKNLVQQWLVYGTGAEISFADRKEIEACLDRVRSSEASEAGSAEYGFRTLLYETIASNIFCSK